MSDTIEQFIDLNTRLFKMCDENTAKAHLASLVHPAARYLAESLWRIELCERAIAARNA